MKKYKDSILILIVLLLSACKNEKEYPQAVLDNFVKSCKQQAGGVNDVLCDCLIIKVQKKYTYKEFMKIESKVDSGVQDKDFLEFIEWANTECGIELSGD